MEEFYVSNSEDIELLKNYKAYVKGTQPFSIQKTIKEKMRDKLDNFLKRSFETAYNAGKDYVENDTVDYYFDKKITDVKGKIDEVNIKRSEAAQYPDDEEEKRYVEFFDKEISKLQRQLIRLVVDKNNPHDISSFAIPKIVFYQIVKETAKKMDKVEKTTDDILMKAYNAVANSQIGEAKKYLQQLIDERDRRLYSDFGPIETIDEDPLIENPEVIVNSKRK